MNTSPPDEEEQTDIVSTHRANSEDEETDNKESDALLGCPTYHPVGNPVRLENCRRRGTQNLHNVVYVTNTGIAFLT